MCPGRTVWGVIPWLWRVPAGGLRASQRTPWSLRVLLCEPETPAAALHVVGGVSHCVGYRAQCGQVVRPTWWPFPSLWFRREHRGLVVRRNQTLHGARGLVGEGPKPCVALSREGRSQCHLISCRCFMDEETEVGAGRQKPLGPYLLVMAQMVACFIHQRCSHGSICRVSPAAKNQEVITSGLRGWLSGQGY